MLIIPCPFCGNRDHSEFQYGGDATVQYPELDAASEEWVQAVMFRDNPRGPHSEFWHHVQGCRQWLIVERDTMTHEISGARMAHTAAEDAFKKEAKS